MACRKPVFSSFAPPKAALLFNSRHDYPHMWCQDACPWRATWLPNLQQKEAIDVVQGAFVGAANRADMHISKREEKTLPSLIRLRRVSPLLLAAVPGTVSLQGVQFDGLYVQGHPPSPSSMANSSAQRSCDSAKKRKATLSVMVPRVHPVA